MIEYLIGFLTNAAIFALFTLGLNLQFGFTGLLNFGHVAFMGLGAYTFALLSVKGWSMFGAVALAVAVPAVFSLFVGLPALRLRDDYLAIVTIGFAETVRITLNNASSITRGPQGVFGYQVPFEGLGLSPLGYRVAFLALCVLVLGGVFLLLEYLTRSPWGRVLKAIREDEDAARALGKNTVWYKLQVFAVGAAVAGLAGILLAFFFRYINPRNFVPLMTFVAWMIMVLGGTASNWGTLVGAILYFGVMSLTQFLAGEGLLPITDAQLGALRVVFIGFLLVVLMLKRPQGLFGRKEELSLDR